MKQALVTGSAGLVGSSAALFFGNHGFTVVGIDNDMRRTLFGEGATTKNTEDQLRTTLGGAYVPYHVDIRDSAALQKIFKEHSPFDVIIHTAAQPSHDWAATNPVLDFDINARATLLLLEHVRMYSPDAVFLFTSTNKVYGDLPNSLPFVEFDTRYDLPRSNQYFNGIGEEFSIDQSMHSFLGVSKASADLLVQEYGRYFGLKTASFRAGCITGAMHQGVELHGFLAYLVKCVAEGKRYRIFGYKGKQVRDQIHAHDLVQMFWHFYQNPRCGEVYNAGGGRESNVSIIEALGAVEKILGRRANTEYVPDVRKGDHQWYVSNVSKFRSHYPNWEMTYTVDTILNELCSRHAQ